MRIANGTAGGGGATPTAIRVGSDEASAPKELSGKAGTVSGGRATDGPGMRGKRRSDTARCAAATEGDGGAGALGSREICGGGTETSGRESFGGEGAGASTAGAASRGTPIRASCRCPSDKDGRGGTGAAGSLAICDAGTETSGMDSSGSTGTGASTAGATNRGTLSCAT
jgi:hypothetical protein